MLICPTFAHNKTLFRFAERDPCFNPIHLRETPSGTLFEIVFEGANTLIVLDDCAASKDVKGRTSKLMKFGFSTCHANMSVWLLTQQLSNIAKPFCENVAAIMLFYTPSTKTTKAIFEEYVGELSLATLKEIKFSHLVFSLCHPYEIEWKTENDN